MTCSKFTPLLFAAALWIAAPATAHAQRGHAVARGGGQVAGHAVPRVPGGRPVVVSPRIVSPRVIGVVPFRPYFPYRRRITVGFFGAFGYPYYPYAYPYPYYYPYAYPGYGYPLGYVGGAYGGVRIDGAPEDAQVFADGYYVGVVDDFDGRFQHLNLTAGPHRIEIRMAGRQPIAFEVNVQPGETIRLRAR
jgi:hypothetical protein